MRTFQFTRCALLLVLMAPPALAREMEEKLTIRTLKVPEHPNREAPSIYVSGQVVTVLRFDQEVDPAKTRLLAWEGRFEPLLVGSKKVVLEPLRDLDHGEALPLLVNLVDGTELTFLVKPKSRESWGWIDYQVNVFKDHDSYNAVLSSLYDSLNRERDLRKENERLKQQENSIDHALATLLANGEAKKTSFRRVKAVRPKSDGMDMIVEFFSGPGKAAVVVTLTNTYYGEPWTLDRAYLTHDFASYTTRPFALRMDQNAIAPGQSGKIAVVVDGSAFQAGEGHLDALALQIFRGDGILQVAVTLEHTLIRQ